MFPAFGMLSVMSNTSLEIKLQPAERTQLEKWESSHPTLTVSTDTSAESVAGQGFPADTENRRVRRFFLGSAEPENRRGRLDVEGFQSLSR